MSIVGSDEEEELNINVLNIDDVDKLIEDIGQDSESACSSQYSAAPSSAAPQSLPRRRAPAVLPPNREIKEKNEILYQFSRLVNKGVKLPNTFTIDSDLDEMRTELNRLTRDYAVDKSIGYQRRMVMTTVTTVEYLNTTFEKYTNVKLQGWSEQVNESIGDYDDVFEELYDLYKDRANIRPELRLIFGIGCSGVLFHLTNTFIKQYAPAGSEEFLRQNPELMKQFMSAASSTMQNSMQS
jgi:hypothetical protein